MKRRSFVQGAAAASLPPDAHCRACRHDDCRQRHCEHQQPHVAARQPRVSRVDARASALLLHCRPPAALPAVDADGGAPAPFHLAPVALAAVGADGRAPAALHLARVAAAAVGADARAAALLAHVLLPPVRALRPLLHHGSISRTLLQACAARAGVAGERRVRVRRPAHAALRFEEPNEKEEERGPRFLPHTRYGMR